MGKKAAKKTANKEERKSVPAPLLVKKLSIPCDFGDKNQPVDFYIGSPKAENGPIQNQSHWMSSERGGAVPPAVMESLTKIRALSEQNNVPFPELCEYAINQVNGGGEGNGQLIDETKQRAKDQLAIDSEKERLGIGQSEQSAPAPEVAQEPAPVAPAPEVVQEPAPLAPAPEVAQEPAPSEDNNQTSRVISNAEKDLEKLNKELEELDNL